MDDRIEGLKAEKKKLKGTFLEASIDEIIFQEEEVGLEEIEKRDIKTLTPINIPLGCLSLIGGQKGISKSSLCLKLCVEYCLKHDKKFLYVTQENYPPFIRKLVEQFGDKEAKTLKFIRLSDDLSPDMISSNTVREKLPKFLESGRYAFVLIDPIYLLFKKQNDNDAIQQDLQPMLNSLHENTSLLGICHLAKDIKGKDMLDHIRGGTEMTAKARKVFYVREGKEGLKRVMVIVKDSFSGPNIGLLTEMKDIDSDITYKVIDGEFEWILKEYAKPFRESTNWSSATQGEKAEQLSKIRKWIEEQDHPDVQLFMDYCTDEFSIHQNTARKRLYDAGYKIKREGFQGKTFIIKR